MTRPVHLAWRAWRAPIAAALLAAALAAGDWLWRIDVSIYDQLLWLRTRSAPADLTIVAVDDASLARLGRWPWPRRLHAELIDALGRAGARAIVFDVAFSEPAVPEEDARLVEAVRRNGRVVLPLLVEQAANGAPVEAPPAAGLSQAAAALGHVDVDVDEDGVTRGVYLHGGIGQPRWPSLPLAALALVDPDRERRYRSVPEGPRAALSWSRSRRVLVPFSMPGHYHRLSYVDVLEGRAPARFLDRAVVFVGTTAAGLGGRIATPRAAAAPLSGVEAMAAVFDALRDGNALDYAGTGATIALSAALAGGITLIVGFVPAAVALALAVAVPLLVSAGLLLATALWFTPGAALLAGLAGAAAQAWLAKGGTTHELQREHRRAEVALGSVQEAVLTVDAQGRIEYVNAVGEQWIGAAAADLIGRPFAGALRLVDERMRALRPADLVARGRADGFLIDRGGTRRRVRGSAVEIHDSRGQSQGMVVALAAAASVRPDPATYDPLTGLPNQTFVRSHLAAVLDEARSTGQRGAVVVLDVERLRDVNVAFGREAGDRLLKATATRLRRETSGLGFVGRLAGGEFVVVFDDLRLDDDASTLGTEILRALAQPFHLEGEEGEVRVSLRAGVSLFPADGREPDTLLQRADTAMRAGVPLGVDRSIRLYQHEMAQLSRDRVMLTRALQLAIERSTLSLAYQPIVDLRTGALVGVEALARWREGEQGSIPPSTFVPLAEETGLIGRLGEWTLTEACRQAEAWDAAGLPPFWVSVNVSPAQFLQPDFVHSVGRVVAASGVPPSRLMLEVTESALHDVQSAAAILERVRSTGIAVALDDFGVGYSSLSHLRMLPVDVVKLDRSFVSGIDAEGPDRTICLAVLSLAASLDRRVVAEGVETGSQAEFLRSKGCREVQGFYIGKPSTAAQIARLVEQGVPVPAAMQPSLPFA